MRDKELTILKFLSTGQLGYVFSMSAFLDISVRTIKSYISNINSEIPNLIESSRKGYMYGIKTAGQRNKLGKASYSPQTVEDRKNILRKLLLETDMRPRQPCNRAVHFPSNLDK